MLRVDWSRLWEWMSTRSKMTSLACLLTPWKNFRIFSPELLFYWPTLTELAAITFILANWCFALRKTRHCLLFDKTWGRILNTWSPVATATSLTEVFFFCLFFFNRDHIYVPFHTNEQLLTKSMMFLKLYLYKFLWEFLRFCFYKKDGYWRIYCWSDLH